MPAEEANLDQQPDKECSLTEWQNCIMICLAILGKLSTQRSLRKDYEVTLLASNLLA
jgi:hypothetical protein